jgi:hypothetical protein
MAFIWPPHKKANLRELDAGDRGNLILLAMWLRLYKYRLESTSRIAYQRTRRLRATYDGWLTFVRREWALEMIQEIEVMNRKKGSTSHYRIASIALRTACCAD